MTKLTAKAIPIRDVAVYVINGSIHFRLAPLRLDVLYAILRRNPRFAARMNFVDGADEFVKPRNVGVLFFHDEPRKFLPGARVDVVAFTDGPGGDVFTEKSIFGPRDKQPRVVALRHIENNAIRRKIIEQGDRAEATCILNYPFPAIERSVVDAIETAALGSS